ncbi:MAG: hypothetical protein LBO70_05005 [Clostridiales Family XIII bacterium]|jgi:hypothetical protein|nr:hypothetical protein [Clostridiales Family XIII bacterium]
MKAKIRHLKTAIYDRAEAVEIIRGYFTDKQEPNLLSKHLKQFRDEFANKEEVLRNSPLVYQVREDYPFSEFNEEIRSFTVHWFTAFYYFDGEYVNIVYVRPSRSDFAVIPFPNQN